MTSKRVLVTGAGGFIGRWSVPALLAAGYEVHAVLTRTTRRTLPAALQGAVLHAADLLESNVLDVLMATVAPTHLLHFAWIATPGVYWTSAENYRWLAAGEHLLEAFVAQGGRRAVMAGSCAEYDWSKVGVCDEASSPLAGSGGTLLTPYAECKIAMQRRLRNVADAGDLSAAWGRIFFQYGPAEQRERLVASVILNLLHGREAPASHGRQVRSFLHVADVASAFVALLDGTVEGAVNIGSGEPVSIGEVLRLVAHRIQGRGLLRLGARSAPAGEPAILVPDVTRLRDEVGWRPRFSLEDGLSDTVEWWRAHLRDDAVAGRA